MTAETAITIRDVLRLLLAADSYPCLGNGDWRVADLLEAEALEKAKSAVPSPDDPPEFRRWLAALLDPATTQDQRDEVLGSLYDLFDPERD